MSLDFYLHTREKVSEECVCPTCWTSHKTEEAPRTLYSRNITHNLGRMFDDAGAYQILWHGDGMAAKDVIEPLKAAHKLMLADPERFKKFNASNGWGLYEHALDFLTDVIRACEENPEGIIHCG